jgi:hypothetical protein
MTTPSGQGCFRGLYAALAFALLVTTALATLAFWPRGPRFAQRPLVGFESDEPPTAQAR